MVIVFAHGSNAQGRAVGCIVGLGLRPVKVEEISTTCARYFMSISRAGIMPTIPGEAGFATR
jgi:hypothetical protein